MEKWRLEYINKKGENKVCILSSKESKITALNTCSDNNIKVVSIDKLYPFSTAKNQHNFELIRNVCLNIMDDMLDGAIPYDEFEFDKLYNMKEKAERYFCLDLPVAWLKWDDWTSANELANTATMHRQDACIKNGRPDLVTYC